MTLRDLQNRLARFTEDRDWEQFHSPKNLVMALAGEVGELVSLFQWLTPDESSAIMKGPRAEQVQAEIADVLAYLLRLADVLGVDIQAALLRKLELNERRYPVGLARGTSAKYTELVAPAQPPEEAP